MNYNGIQLCLTHVFQPGGAVDPKTGYRPRYSFVTDEKGFPYESLGGYRWGVLKRMSDEEDGWVRVGTFPVGTQPADIWKEAKG